MTTLLEKAKECPRKIQFNQPITDEHIELAFAWLKGEVSNKGVARAMKFEGTNYTTKVIQFVIKVLQKALERDKIIFKNMEWFVHVPQL